MLLNPAQALLDLWLVAGNGRTAQGLRAANAPAADRSVSRIQAEGFQTKSWRNRHLTPIGLADWAIVCARYAATWYGIVRYLARKTPMPRHLPFCALLAERRQLVDECRKMASGLSLEMARFTSRLDAVATRIAFSKMLLASRVWTAADIQRPAPKRPGASCAASGPESGAGPSA
jgi:hypothetical protein